MNCGPEKVYDQKFCAFTVVYSDKKVEGVLNGSEFPSVKFHNAKIEAIVICTVYKN